MSFADFFLKNPKVFGPDTGLKLWGEESLDIGIAGIGFRFTGLSERQVDRVRQRFDGFLLDNPTDHPTILTEIYRTSTELFRPFDKRGWTYTLDMDYQPDRLRVVGSEWMADIDCSGNLTASLWTSTEHDLLFELAFGNALRILTAYAALLRGGMMLHSAGISDGERAWIGFGHSGAGKSTLSGLALEAGQRVLSDDINVLNYNQGLWRAQRLPFAGDLGPTHGDDRAVPIASILHLRQGPQHRLEPLARIKCLAALVGSAPYVNADPYRVKRLIANMESLTASVPCHTLTFRRDTGFWPLLYEMSPARPIHGGDPLSQSQYRRET